MANETVLRCLRRSAKTRSTAASFAMDAQPYDSWAEQTPRGARVLSEAGGESEVEFARTCPPDQNRGLRTNCPVGQETRSTAATFAPGRNRRLQRQLPARLPRPAPASQRGRSANQPAAQSAQISHRTRRRLRICGRKSLRA